MSSYGANKSNAKTKSTSGSPKSYPVHSTLVNIYLVLMFSFFPLFLSDKYSRIRHDKYYVFLILTGALVISAGTSYLITRHEERLSTGAAAPFMKPLSVTDIAFFAFFAAAVISAVFSPYFADTVSAERGRNNGLLLLLAYLAAYIIITRMAVFRDYVLSVYLIFSAIVAGLAVLNYFYIDPLGLFEKYGSSVVADFGSTIGNKNLIASYMSMFMPISVMTFVLGKKPSIRVIAGISIVFAGAGALCSDSGSAILAAGAIVPIAAILCAKSYDRLSRYLLAVTLLLASIKALRLFSLIMGDKSKGFELIQDFLIYNKLTYIAIAVFAAMYALSLIMRSLLEPRYNGRLTRVVLISVTGAAVVGLLSAVIYYSVIDTEAGLGAFERVLRFDDRWGTHRGFMWIRSLREYGGFDLFRKLFGIGPDMAYYVLEPYFGELMERFGDSSTNTAHNEYLNYLLTQGAVGLAAYMTALISVCIRALRRSEKEPTALIFICAIMGYAVQAAVNIYQPITTPLFIIFIAIAESLNRRTDVVG